MPFIVTRLGLCLIGWLGLHLMELPTSFPHPWEIGRDGERHPLVERLSPNVHPFVNMWSRWDAGWYLDLAKNGYQYQPGEPSNAAFFPLYPWLIQSVHRLLFLPRTDYWLLVTGIALSNLFLLAALTYLRALLRLDYSDTVASHTLFYLLVFPTTFFFSSVYTESLFLALLVGSFYYARTNRWISACLLAGLATLTRSQGVILIVPLLVEYFAQRGFNLRRVRSNLLAIAFIPAALALFAAFLRLKFENWSVIFDVQRPWGRQLRWPWHTLGWILRSTPLPRQDLIDLCFLALLAAAATIGLFKLRFSYSAFAWVSVIFFASWGMLGSVPRFVLVVFPMFVVFAILTEKRPVLHWALTAIFAVLAGIFMIVHSQWSWVA